jgi:hypothetical protein
MKKILLIIFIIALIQKGLFAANNEFLLGTVESRMGKVKILYIQAKRNNIRFEVINSKISAVIYLDQDMNNFKSHVDKFYKWYKTATDNNYDLNRKIGEVSSFIVDFITYEKKYEIAFTTYDGMRLMTFDLDNIKKVMEIISDKNIDYVINEEKRKKEKEDELFQ